MSNRMWRAYERAQISAATIEGELSALDINLSIIGSDLPFRTFPEGRLVPIAEKLEQLAKSAREMDANAAMYRRQSAEAEQRVERLFLEAAE